MELFDPNDSVNTHLATFLKELKAENEKIAYRGSSHRYLAPFSRLKTHTHNSRSDTVLALFAACFPFLSLEPHSKSVPKASNPATMHSKMTLFQNKSGRSEHRLDRSQAICEQPDIGGDQFLHVSQLWLFIVNDGNRWARFVPLS